MSFQVADRESKAPFLDLVIIVTAVEPEGPELICTYQIADKLENTPV